MEDLLDNTTKKEAEFIYKLENTLLTVFQNYAEANRDKFSVIDEIKAKKFIQRVIEGELDFLFNHPEEYSEIYLEDEESE